MSTTSDTWKECKQYIVCDAEGCDKKAPSSRCGKCHMVYYCSRDCQVQHWKLHKADCIPIEKMRESIAGVGKESSKGLIQLEPDEAAVQEALAKSPECTICLENFNTTSSNKPIVLAKCHHVFCFSCLKQWNDTQTNYPMMQELEDYPSPASTPATPTCPLCRQETPNISQAPMKNALQLLATASIKKESAPEECRQLCQQARTQVDLVLSSDSSKLTLVQDIQGAIILGEAALLCQEYDQAITIFQEAANKLEEAVARNQQMDELMKQAEQIKDDPQQEEECNRLLDQVMEMNQIGHAGPKEHVAMLLKLGQAQRLAQEWEAAKATYQDLASRYMQDQANLTPQQHRETFTSMSECAYHLGRMDIAIDLGQGAIQMNRFFPWSHKFVALALKAKGDVEAAQQTAAEAVIYETPWDDKHKQQVQEWYQENFQ